MTTRSDLATLVKAVAKGLKARDLEVLLVIPSRKAGYGVKECAHTCV